MSEFRKVSINKKFKEIQVPTESIFKNTILLSPTHETKRSSRYQSKYNDLTRQFYESVKKSHQSMGYSKVPLKTPHEYLKKNTKASNENTEIKHLRCHDYVHKKPPVPKHDEVPPVFNSEDKKNFMELNRLNAVRKPALKPTKKYADNKWGDTFLLEFSGLVPKFISKKEFGKTPKYLVQRKKDMDYSREVREKSAEDTKLIELSTEERNHLLEGLRTNWEYLYKKYMTLPLKIDTKSMKSKKLELERQLDLLEHDIYFLEKNEDNEIYIMPD